MDQNRSLLPDLCQCVWARDWEAVKAAGPCLPLSVVPDLHDSLRARYRCPDCGRMWNVWWHREAAGWPEDWEAA
jgi:hypothetical protein